MSKPKFFIDDTGKPVPKKPKGQRVSTVPVSRSFIPISYANDIELASWAGLGYSMVFDIESYINYFLIGFKCIETQKYVIFEDSPDSFIDIEKLNWLIHNFRLIGFYSNGYDMPIMLLAMQGHRAEMLKYFTNRLIRKGHDGKPERVDWRKEFNLRTPSIDHIDIIGVCPLTGSLKKYAGRLHAKRMQDLPFPIEHICTKQDSEEIKNYCLGSDIVNTEMIFLQLGDQIKLRYDLNSKYGVDVRSKSDAQIAETVIKSEVKKKLGKDVKRYTPAPGTKFQYKPADYIKFNSSILQKVFKDICNLEFEITEEGKLSMPEALKEMEAKIGKTTYKFGKGGLHSKEKCTSYKAENGWMIIDSDVESYYPKLILNSGLYPEAIGPIFLEIFKEIVDRRLLAKENAKIAENELKNLFDKLSVKYQELSLTFEYNQSEADGLKITINGTFGKLGSRWSIMFAPNLLIQTTIGGQLSLAMFIERCEASGIEVISANTDGVVVYCHESQYELLKRIREDWCSECNFKMEETRYKALYSRDVNNYIAIKMDGKAKLKGTYSNPWNDKKTAIFRFHKNPMTTICIEAVEKMLTCGHPIDQTIQECQDLRKFVCVRDVKGGAHKNGIFLGKVVRWYYGIGEKGTINYILNGNNVSETEGAVPLMDMPDELPEDLDYNYYVEKANAILLDIGFYEKAKELELF